MSKVDVRWKMNGWERLQTFLVSVAMGVAGWIGLGIAETETALLFSAGGLLLGGVGVIGAMWGAQQRSY